MLVIAGGACSDAPGGLLKTPQDRPADALVPIGQGDAMVESGLNDDCSPVEGVRPSCARPNATASCFDGECAIVSCDHSYADCDRDPGNGCEASLESVEHCGLCGAACRFPNAVGACVEGECVFDGCVPDHGDCDGVADNGCEVPLDTTSNCGACGQTCEQPPHGVAACTEDGCGVGECAPGFGDCDGEPGNGCETELVTLEHCAACGRSCTPEGGTGDCASGSCVIVGCEGNLVDCNGLAEDGCETTLEAPDHCGQCGARCALPHVAHHACQAGTCLIDRSCSEGASECVEGDTANGCEAGFADCDGIDANGCETALTTLTNCGGCGVSCSFPNGEAKCETGACELATCRPSFDVCGGSGCQSLADDPQNCGQCDSVCSDATPNCHGTVCTAESCGLGRADCDLSPDNGCEVDLTSTSNCLACGLKCGPYGNATAGCGPEGCRIETCEPGFDDCDGSVGNGCEADLTALDSCGGCGQSCAVPNGVGSCDNATCELMECDPGRADCNGELTDGCETNLLLPRSCGQCGRDCMALPNVLSASCQTGACALVCQGQRGDCDGVPDNGCEADLASAATCGSCGNDCSALPNVVSAQCQDGGCRQLVCAAGFGDCDGNTSNGCERSLRTLSDCGGCDLPCTPAHASASCDKGACTVASCDKGFDDCNGDARDGCEAALASTPSHCGACGQACGEGTSCIGGVCTCDGTTQCAPGEECCNGACIVTDGAQCYPWPCIPGTNLDPDNCGGCGKECGFSALWCCGPLL